MPSRPRKAVVHRNTEEVQGGGSFDVFEELFADDFVDHTPGNITCGHSSDDGRQGRIGKSFLK